MTIFSKAFDFGRRSWMLKLDLDSDNNVSAFIVERGAPINLQDNLVSIGVNVPIRFSSVLI